MEDNLDLIASLLDNPEEEIADEIRLTVPDTSLSGPTSEVHKGDTDSSDDEDNKYFESSYYNSFGRAIKTKLKENNNINEHFGIRERGGTWKKSQDVLNFNVSLPTASITKRDVYAEPIFGLRIINPVISSQELKERMKGKLAVSFMKVKNHVAHGDLKTDWVIAGVIVSKSSTKISQKGSQYMVWRLSDLKDKLLTVSVFLFGKSYNSLWKTNVGCVIGILNPNVLNNKNDSKDEATLSVFNPDQVMLWGSSKDLGTCKSKKKNGEKCTNFVNLYQCEFCVHHVQTEYRKFSGRSELQSSTCGSLVNLRNKVLGKNEVFYGGKIFTSVPPPNKQSKVQQKDINRLGKLGVTVSDKLLPKPTGQLPHCPRSEELLKMLSGTGKKERKEVDGGSDRTAKKKYVEIKIGENECQNSEDNNRLPSNKMSFPLLSDPSLDESRHNSIKQKLDQKLTPLSKHKTSNLKNRFNSIAAINIVGKTTSPINDPIKEGPVLISDSKKNQDNLGVQKKLENTLTQTKSSEALSLTVMIPSSGTNVKNEVKQYPVSTNIGTNIKESLIVKESLAKIGLQKNSKAKEKALQFVRQNGPINNNLSKVLDNNKGNKRVLPFEEEEGEENKKKKYALSERFIELMKQPPVNEELVDYNHTKNFTEYYDRMEKKEQMEEKMLNTFKVDCKAVKCLKCKYTWFSASEMCKSEGHPIKIVDAEKRFFKCGKCSNRTVSLALIPLVSCRNCGSSNWLKAPMIREKVKTSSVTLSIRGGEQQFINSQVTDANLDLLIGED